MENLIGGFHVKPAGSGELPAGLVRASVEEIRVSARANRPEKLFISGAWTIRL
jgi:hypothetical protein